MHPQARINKAARIVAILRRAGATVEQVERLDDSGWSYACIMAGTKLPSDETKAVCVAIMRGEINA